MGEEITAFFDAVTILEHFLYNPECSIVAQGYAYRIRDNKADCCPPCQTRSVRASLVFVPACVDLCTSTVPF